MSVIRLLLREIQHRKLNFLLALLSVVLAVGLAVAIRTLRQASQRETTALMLDLEYNVIILPKDVDKIEYLRSGYSQAVMPESYVHKLAHSKTVVVRHLRARLQQTKPWRGKTILLTGLLPETPLARKKAKPPLGVEVARGEVVLGYQIAGATRLVEGDEITDLAPGKTLRVAGVLAERGTVDDARVFGHLRDVQAILGQNEKINEIQALSCVCPGVKPEDMLEFIRKDIARTLPGAHVVRVQPTADVRLKTRLMDSNQSLYLVAAVVVACCVWMALLALGNVRERRREIGVLRAMGVGGGKVAAMFLGKAVVLGVAGAALGFIVGTGFAAMVGPAIFHSARAKITPAYGLLALLMLVAPLLCVLASYFPAMLAVAQDPAVVLREE